MRIFGAAAQPSDKEREKYEDVRCLDIAALKLHEFQELFFESGKPYIEWLKPSQARDAVLKFGDQFPESQLRACLPMVNPSKLDDEAFEAIFKVKIGTPDREQWSAVTHTRLGMLSLEHSLEQLKGSQKELK